MITFSLFHLSFNPSQIHRQAINSHPKKKYSWIFKTGDEKIYMQKMQLMRYNDINKGRPIPKSVSAVTNEIFISAQLYKKVRCIFDKTTPVVSHFKVQVPHNQLCLRIFVMLLRVNNSNYVNNPYF